MASVKLDTLDRLELWLKGPSYPSLRDVSIERRNIPGYGQMVEGFRVQLFDHNRKGVAGVGHWTRQAEAKTLAAAITQALDKARFRKTRAHA